MKRFRPVQFDEEAAHFVRVGEAVHQCKGIDPGRSVNVFAVVDEQIDLAEARIRRGERPSRVRCHARRSCEDAQGYLLGQTAAPRRPASPGRR